MVQQRTPSSGELPGQFQVMSAPFDIHDGAIDPILAMQELDIPKFHALLPAHADAESFEVTLAPTLGRQMDSRHQPYFAELKVGDDTQATVIKTYNKANGAENWRKEIAAHERARRAGLPTLTPTILARYGSATLLGTTFVDDLYDLERRYRGLTPEGYEIDEITLLASSAAALAALHNSDVIHGDAAPRNFAFRGSTLGHKQPVLIDPETYIFPGEQRASEVKKMKQADLEQLISESARAIAGKEDSHRKAKIDDRAQQNAAARARDTIMPVYLNVTGHSF